MTQALENANALSSYISSTVERQLPVEIIDAARMCLADWLATVVGAHDQGAGQVARKALSAWSQNGRAPVFQGGRQSPLTAALVNGTFAHCLDYDDTHLGCLAHLSGPTWAAALAMTAELQSGDQEALKAFVTGFETGAKIGGLKFGETVNKRGFHATSVLGRFSAAAAASSLMGLNKDQIVNALGIAATTAGGLVASFGTMSKPFHAGKAAMDGVLAAQLASCGFEAKKDLLETGGDNLAAALIQNGEAGIQELHFNGEWEILQNTFKPYAACLLVHPAVSSARDIFSQIDGREIKKVQARINPMVERFAAKTDPKEPLEGKFSIAYCAALGLCGHDASEQDFTAKRLGDTKVREMMAKVELANDDSIATTAASMTVTFADGSELTADTPLALGNPGNPLGWEGMRRKFMSLVEPVYGPQSEALFELAQTAGDGNSLQQIAVMLSEKTVH